MTPNAPHRVAPLHPSDCEQIAGDLAQRGRQAAATAAHLAQLRQHQRTCASGPYRVFHLLATRQFVVLRDVSTVVGATCVHECGAFEDALRWTNQQLLSDLLTVPA